MKKRILPFILSGILCFAALCPLSVRAAEPDAQASLTLHYQKDAEVFTDLPIGIYRVAELLSDGSCQLLAPFASYPISIHGITTQEQWNQVAQTLWSYIVADQVAPHREAHTDDGGTVYFSDLETGLYFVREAIGENTGGTYLFNQFMVYVPTPNPDGSYTYAVEAKPKCVGFVPKSQYTVTKLWQDGGDSDFRPKEVTVDIYKDGQLQETKVLSADNNWTYTWYVSENDPGQWTVTERAVADGYKVTIRQNGSHFSIINTAKTPPDVPNTGDTFSPLPFILLMCFSGIMLVILGIYSRRRK